MFLGRTTDRHLYRARYLNITFLLMKKFVTILLSLAVFLFVATGLSEEYRVITRALEITAAYGWFLVEVYFLIYEVKK